MVTCVSAVLDVKARSGRVRCHAIAGLVFLQLVGISLAVDCPPNPPPGIVVAHWAASTGKYVGSPSLVILPNGEFVASHDGFGPEHQFARTYLFRSVDGGNTWIHLGEVDRQNTSTLFVHRGHLYLMGLGSIPANSDQSNSTSKAATNGVLIRRSEDGGHTWTSPQDENTGVLLRDGPFSTAPVPVVVYAGRIWRAMEDAKGPQGWAKCFRAFIMSAPEDSDLLSAANWSRSNALAGNTAWLNREFEGWLEGNVVVTPEGRIANILRVHYFNPNGDKAAKIDISPDGKLACFDPDTGFLNLPDAAKKFTIRFDPISNTYWTLTNAVPRRHRPGGSAYEGGNPESTRNTLTVVSSPDLKIWTIRSIVLYHPDTRMHGFQYADWQFDGADLVAVVRTAYDDSRGGAHDMHDANFLTFHRIQNFRKLLNQPIYDPQNLFRECAHVEDTSAP